MAGGDAALAARLKELRLPAIRACYRAEADAARRASLSYERYLAELAEREAEARRTGRVERLLRASRLPAGKTMAALDVSRLPVKVAQQVSVLADGSFLARAENVLAFGNPEPLT